MDANASYLEIEAKLQAGEAIEFPQLPAKQLEEQYAFAYSLYENGKYDEASHLFRFLTLMDSQNARNWMGLAASYQLAKKYEEALDAYSFALILDSDNPYVYIHAADCYFGLNQKDLALDAIKYARAIASRDEKYQSLVPQLTLMRKRWINPGNEG
jgi:type III secretion system low calcium response chaperone LcrH/SycD